jgi:hypothetical protein
MTTKEQRRQEWIARIADYKTSGLTMSSWCAAQHVTKTHLSIGSANLILLLGHAYWRS